MLPVRSWTQNSFPKKDHTKIRQELKIQTSLLTQEFSPSSWGVLGRAQTLPRVAYTDLGSRNTFIFLIPLLKSSLRPACSQSPIGLSVNFSSKPAHPNSTQHLSRKKSFFLHVAKPPFFFRKDGYISHYFLHNSANILSSST